MISKPFTKWRCVYISLTVFLTLHFATHTHTRTDTATDARHSRIYSPLKMRSRINDSISARLVDSRSIELNAGNYGRRNYLRRNEKLATMRYGNLTEQLLRTKFAAA